MRNRGLLKFLMMFCFLGAVLLSCNNDDDDEKVDLDAVYKFEVSFYGQWSADVYGDLFPDNAEFSSFVGLTHAKRNSLFSIGRTASSGLAEYCKSGVSTELETEINKLNNGNPYPVLVKTESITAEGDIKATFNTNLRQRYFTCVGKIAPSPDWFVSIENIDMRLLSNKGSGMTVLFKVNDAGVKDGLSFTVSGNDTADRISRVSSGNLAIEGAVPTIGYFTIENKGLVSSGN